MRVGDKILITELATGKTWEEIITRGSPPAGLFTSESGITFWASGIQWTPNVAPHQTKPKIYSCKVIYD